MRQRIHHFTAAAVCALLMVGCGGGDEITREPESTLLNGAGAARNATALNSGRDEFAPVLLDDGMTCLVTSNREQEGSTRVLSPEFLFGEAVYAVSRPAASPMLTLDRVETWSPLAKLAPGRLDRVNSGTPAFDPATGRIYYGATYLNTGDGGTDIHSLPWPVPGEADTAASPESAARNERTLNSRWWEAHPTIAPDGSAMVFASDRIATLPSVSDTGRRAPRLWIARKAGEGWGTPELLPEPVNSGTAEMSPHFGVDGWLYFATKRWPDAGFEIVRSRYDEGKWTQPERLRAPFNSTFDDVFPFLSADRMQLLFSSNRPGGKGGYDIWFSEVKYCVPLEVLVRLTDADGSESSAQPAADVELEVVETATGRTVLRESTAGDGRMNAQCLPVNTGMIVRPSARNCYQNPGGVEFTTPLPADIGDGVRITIDLKRLALPEFYVVSDSIPFFVTGYWYPNTTTELRRLRGRLTGGKELPTANFIDTTDYDYDAAALRVDQWFDKLYGEIDRMLVPMLDTCYGAADTLIITVVGHVDPRGLAWGKFDEKEEIRTLGAVISPGDVMQRQEGNVKLSHLRAWYAMRMIDTQMDSRSDRYRFLRAQHRIRYQANGGEIGYGEGGTKAGPINDALKRKFTVAVEVRKKR
ncbi:MAG: hypothetical protein RBU27_07275 [Bacteroidota bacterium]|jgi:hypothetical protein|nr:hypothetical protein [Bacteroidota bacterium]